MCTLKDEITQQTKEYMVNWTLPIEAESEQDAAEQLRDMLIDPAIVGTLFSEIDTNDEGAQTTSNMLGIPSDSGLAKFVTLTAYNGAGGRLLVDVKSGSSILVDVSLVKNLAKHKLSEVANALTGWKWVKTSLDGNYGLHRFTMIPHKYNIPSDIDIEKRITRSALMESTEYDWQDNEEGIDSYREYHADLLKQYRDLEDVVDKHHRTFDPVDMKYAGCIVTFDQTTGNLVVHKGLMDDKDESDFCNRGNEIPSEALALKNTSKSSHGQYTRTMVRSTLLDNSSIAAELCQFQTCMNVFSQLRPDYLENRLFSPLALSAEVRLNELTSNKHRLYDVSLSDAFARLDLSWLPKRSKIESFEAFSNLSPRKRNDLMAFVASISLQYSDARTTDDEFMRSLLRNLGVNPIESSPKTVIR